MTNEEASELRREARAWALVVYQDKGIMNLFDETWEDLFNDALYVVLSKFENNTYTHKKRIILRTMRWEILRLINPDAKQNRTISATKLAPGDVTMWQYLDFKADENLLFEYNEFIQSIDDSICSLEMRIFREMKHLTEKGKMIIGFYQSGMDFSQIGDLMGLSARSVHNSFVRNLGTLKKLVHET